MPRNNASVFRLPFSVSFFLLAATAALGITTNDVNRYVRERMWPMHPDHPAAADLREELEFEITRMLDRYDTGGHLEPAYFSIGITGGWLLYGYPGEQAYILADALPFLTTASQARVKAYLYDEIRAYDPTLIGFEHCTDGWGACDMVGNRREFFTIPTSPNPEPIQHNIFPSEPVRPEGLYMIWRYCDRTEDWAFISTNSPPTGPRWARMTNLFNTISNPPVRYGQIAAAIGFARILDHYGLTNGHPYTTALARVHSGLLAGTNFNLFVNRSYTNFITGPHDWAWTPFHYARAGTAIGAMLAPEIGRFLREFAYTSVYRRVTDNPLGGQTNQPYAVESIWQGWYLTRGHYIPLIPIMGYYGENHMVTPDTPWALFMTHAWVYNESGPELRRWLDVPFCIGDLFHIQKLTATIAAHGGVVWSAVQPPVMKNIQPDPAGLTVAAEGGPATYVVEASDTLAAWTAIATNAGPTIVITNPAAPPVRFFRARSTP
jgi:hypothetical protein